MNMYAKGAHYERELMLLLKDRGFVTARIAGSGIGSAPADILAFKKGVVVGIECKAHKIKPKLQKDKIQEMKMWCEKAGALGILAWRTKNKWLFLRLEDAENKKYEDENWLEMEKMLRFF